VQLYKCIGLEKLCGKKISTDSKCRFAYLIQFFKVFEYIVPTQKTDYMKKIMTVLLIASLLFSLLAEEMEETMLPN
jgi:hypothetical protein